jgi:predicted sulfurtransferase
MGNRLKIGLFLIVVLGLAVNPAFGADIPKKLSDVKRITVEETRQLMQKEDVLVIDTRAPGEWLRAKDKAAGAVRITTPDELSRLTAGIPRDKAIVTYCT